MIRLSQAQVSSWRLTRNHLDKRAPRQQLARVVSDVCGIQAQVLSGAAIAIWARVDGLKLQDVLDSLWKQRVLVKTWSVRGTLHLLSASDLPTYVAALKTRLKDLSEDMFRLHQVSPDDLELILSGIHSALDDGCLTRAELASEVAKRVRLGPRLNRLLLSGWGVLLQPAAYRGSLCFGPSQGQNVTFVRPDRWLGTWDEPRVEKALKTLARRFLTAYGPGTSRDFVHWWGKLRDGAKGIIGSIASELVEVEFEGKRAWVRKLDLERIEQTLPSHSVRLLPSWDCYVMFYHPRELFVAAKFRPKIFRQIQRNSPVLLIDGVAGGVWQKRQRGDRLEVIVEPFDTLNSAQRGLVEEEANRLGEFLGAEVQIRFSK